MNTLLETIIFYNLWEQYVLCKLDFCSGGTLVRAQYFLQQKA